MHGVDQLLGTGLDPRLEMRGDQADRGFPENTGRGAVFVGELRRVSVYYVKTLGVGRCSGDPCVHGRGRRGRVLGRQPAS